MMDLEQAQWERWQRMSEAERSQFLRLGGQPPTEPVRRGLRYNPHTREGWGGQWKTIDANHFGAMREYYTRAKKPDPVKVGDVVHNPKQPLALMPGSQPFGVLTARASC